MTIGAKCFVVAISLKLRPKVILESDVYDTDTKAFMAWPWPKFSPKTSSAALLRIILILKL